MSSDNYTTRADCGVNTRIDVEKLRRNSNFELQEAEGNCRHLIIKYIGKGAKQNDHGKR